MDSLVFVVIHRSYVCRRHMLRANVKLIHFNLPHTKLVRVIWSMNSEYGLLRTGSTVSSLINRLKRPTVSDLSRKRKVQTNPPRGTKRGKGAVAAEPSSVSIGQDPRISG